MKKITAVILAAGKGTRMNSDLPKVLHKICQKPLLFYVLSSVQELGIGTPYVIIGYQAQKVIDSFKNENIEFVLQKEQLGTGHAVMQAEPHFFNKEETVLVLNGDMPLITSSILQDLIDAHVKSKASATVLSAKLADPTGYGRIIKSKNGDLEKIVEQKDASLGELAVNEINTGTYCFESKDLFGSLKEICPENSQHEYYLTDVMQILRKNNKKVSAYCMEDSACALGINTTDQLKTAEKVLEKRRS